MLFMQLLRCMCMPNERIKKPVTFHFSLLIGVIAYAFMGGLVFNYLESSAFHEAKRVVRQQRTECVTQTLIDNRLLLLSSTNSTHVVDAIVDCWQSEADVRNEWSYMTATLYGFGVITTLGYNRIGPITTAGRLFCIVYGLCGIPIAMIILGNVGQFLNQFACDSRRMLEKRLRKTPTTPPVEDSQADASSVSSRSSTIASDDSSSPQITSLFLLGVFLGYVTMGAILLPLLNGRIDFFNGLYYNFLCLTAIDFGALIPQRMAFLPITLAYICVGLAITTIAIDVGSEYMKKLHYLGKRMKSAATTKIWFGGKTLKVRDLLHAVGKIWNVDAHLIAATDLNRVVEEAIARQEGRKYEGSFHGRDDAESGRQQPLLDNDNEAAMPTTTSSITPPAPNQSPPPLSIDSISNTAPVVTSLSPPLIVDNRFEKLRWFMGSTNVVAERLHIKIDDNQITRKKSDPPVEVIEDAALPETISEPLTEEVPIAAAEVVERVTPLFIRPQAPLLLIVESEEDICESELDGQLSCDDKEEDEERRCRDESPDSTCSSSVIDEPKRFREKKEKYARDPHKLFETYSEEWERLEKVNAKKLGGGSRRRSLLQQSGAGGSSPGSTSPR